MNRASRVVTDTAVTQTKPSRSVTPRARCLICGRKFSAPRRDAQYCSTRCRQRAHRARQAASDIDAQIEAARLHYWVLIRRKAEASSKSESQILTDEAPWVDEQGRVFMHGQQVGTKQPHRPGWAAWGLEAAGPPWNPPPYRPPMTKERKRWHKQAARDREEPDLGVELESAVRALCRRRPREAGHLSRDTGTDCPGTPGRDNPPYKGGVPAVSCPGKREKRRRQRQTPVVALLSAIGGQP